MPSALRFRSALTLVLLACGSACASPYLAAERPRAERQSGNSGDVIQIAAGDTQVCALTDRGNVLCWGPAGGHVRVIPETIHGLGFVIQIALEGKHACALELEGGVKCWGENERGSLAQIPQEPTAVGGVVGAVEISTTWDASCARDAQGKVTCWGTRGNKDEGAHTVIAEGALQLTGNVAHQCARLADGRVLCSKIDNPEDTEAGWREIQVDGVMDLEAHGEATCAWTWQGSAFCWGRLEFHEGSYDVPGRSPFPDDVVSFSSATGRGDWCTLRGDGRVACKARKGMWPPASVDDERVFDIPGLERVVQLASSAGQTCALDAVGDVSCWGGVQDPSSVQPWPAEIPAARGARAIAADEDTTCAAIDNEGAVCWGPPSILPQRTPTFVPLWGAVAISVAGHDVCGRAADGHIACSAIDLRDGWHRTYRPAVVGEPRVTADPPEEQWIGEDAPLDVRFADLTHVVRRSGFHSWYGVMPNGTLLLATQQYPIGTKIDVVPLPGPVNEIDAGDELACATIERTGVWCWADDNEPVHVPKLVPNTTGATSVAVGGAHACATFPDGEVACWGANDFGQLGDRTLVSRPEARRVAGLTSVRALALGELHSCAMREDGEVQCWGSKAEGRLGLLFEKRDRHTPLHVEGLR